MKKIISLVLLVLFLSSCVEGKIEISNEQMINEQEKIKIDEYNFEQLEKIKNIFDSDYENKKDVNSLGYFVFEYDTNIVPIKNCYYVSNTNGRYDYIIGFKLESNKYIKKYGTEHYAYPEYDIEPMNICDGDSCDNDMNRYYFERIISNPCKGIIRGLYFEDRDKDGEYKRFKDSTLNGGNSIYIDSNNDGIYLDYEPRSNFINNGFTTGYDSSIYGNYEFNDLDQGVYTIGVVYSKNWTLFTKPKDKKYIVDINNNNLFIKDIDFGVFKEGKFH